MADAPCIIGARTKKENKMASDIIPANSMLTVIERVAADPNSDVAKLEKMLDMQERIIAKQAEMDFNAAMTRLQKVLPTIHQSAEIKHGEKLIAKYAKYEDIDSQIRPFYSAEGFSLSFNSQRQSDGTVIYYGTVAHESGHSRTAEIVLPTDTGPGRNAVQAQGSTLSYAKRYLVMMLLNLVTTNEDDDGRGSSVKPATNDMVAELEELIVKAKADRQKFLEHFKASEVSDLSSNDYSRAVTMLKSKIKASAQ